MSYRDTLKSFFIKFDFNNLGWLDGITYGLCLWFLLYPTPYTLLFCIILCIPLTGIILKAMDGNIHLDDHIITVTHKQYGKRRVIAMYLTTASLVLALRIFLDFECESFYSIFIHASIAFIFLIIAILTTHKKITGTLTQQISLYALLTLNILLYSYAFVYGINCLFDTSAPIQFKTHIADKYITHHRKSPDTYHVTIAPWGHHHDTENLSIRSHQFDKLNKGDDVLIDLQKGLFHIPWYHIDDSDHKSADW